MEIQPESIEELRQIHKKLTGEELTDKEAEEMAENLFRLVAAVYRPIPKDRLEKHLEEYPELQKLLNPAKNTDGENGVIGFK